MNSEIKTGLIFGIIIASGLGVVGVIFLSLDQEVQSSTVFTDMGSLSEINKSGFKKAPKIVGIANYLNITPEELSKEIEGKVILYDIWTYSWMEDHYLWNTLAMTLQITTFYM